MHTTSNVHAVIRGVFALACKIFTRHGPHSCCVPHCDVGGEQHQADVGADVEHDGVEVVAEQRQADQQPFRPEALSQAATEWAEQDFPQVPRGQQYAGQALLGFGIVMAQ